MFPSGSEETPMRRGRGLGGADKTGIFAKQKSPYLRTQHSALCTQHSALSTLHSALCTLHSSALLDFPAENQAIGSHLV